jgi:DNA-binding FadR family transcriptional regulator
MELYSMRYILEGAAAAMAARNATDIELEMLRDLIDGEQPASATAERMAEHNRRLHLAVCQCSHNRYLLKAMSVLTNPLAFLSKTAFSSAERRAAVCIEHRAIIEAICARDPERASRAAHEHMRAAHVVRLRLMGIGSQADNAAGGLATRNREEATEPAQPSSARP